MRAAAGDLTAAARIRGAAVHLFAERGFDGTSIREIAALAGVSPSLVVHHFRTKAQLKAATDAWLTTALVGMLSELPQGEATDVAQSTGSVADRLHGEPDLLAYLRRVLVDGGDAAAGLFVPLVEATAAELAAQEAAGLVRPSSDPRTRATFLVVNDLGAIVLGDLVERTLGVDPFSRDGLRQWGEVVMDVYLRGVYASGPDATTGGKQTGNEGS